MKKVGFLILFLGFAFTIYTSITYYTTVNIAKIGQVEIVKQQANYIKWSPFLGIGIMVIGGYITMKAGKE